MSDDVRQTREREGEKSIYLGRFVLDVIMATSYSDLLRAKQVKTMSARIGKPAPEFKATAVIGGDFKDVSLKDYKGKYLVLFFYPLDFTFVCPTGKLSSKSMDERLSRVIFLIQKSFPSAIVWKNSVKLTVKSWLVRPILTLVILLGELVRCQLRVSLLIGLSSSIDQGQHESKTGRTRQDEHSTDRRQEHGDLE